MPVKPPGRMMIDMFAPYCPTCGHRVLLGTGRLVAFQLQEPPGRIAVRCFCGTVLDALQERPELAAPPAPATDTPAA